MTFWWCQCLFMAQIYSNGSCGTLTVPIQGCTPCNIKFVSFCFTSVVGQGLVLRPRGPQIRFLDLKLRLETMCPFFTEDLMVVSSGHPCTTVHRPSCGASRGVDSEG